MGAITLETLNVVLRAQYAEYQRDMEKAKEATRKARDTVDAEKKKINDSLGASPQIKPKRNWKSYRRRCPNRRNRQPPRRR